MLYTVIERGFTPQSLALDSGYDSIALDDCE
jgi:hypothetical protein